MFIFSTLPLIILSLGAFLLFKLRFFIILHPARTFKLLGADGFSIKALSSLLLALAGTLGVGNIVGVAVGISVGGSGSVFWLMLSAIPSAIIKYSEVTLSIDAGGKRGILGVIEGSFPRCGRGLSVLYSLLCLGLALTMGSSLQSNAIAGAAREALGLKPEYIALPLCIILLFVFCGGGRRLLRAVNLTIPIAVLIYMGICLSVIIPNITALPTVVSDIIADAFTPTGVGGGILGIVTSKKISEGFARGMLSNEAGAGTSSFAHGTDSERLPAVGGVYGIIEVIFDTLLLCPMTAFAILLGTEEGGEISYGISAICDVLRGSGGNLSVSLLFISTAAFAIATIFCWYYYGEVCIKELLPKWGKYLYFPLFILLSALGLFFSSSFIIAATDVLLFIMTAITSAVLIKNCDRIKILSQNCGLLSIENLSEKPD